MLKLASINDSDQLHQKRVNLMLSESLPTRYPWELRLGLKGAKLMFCQMLDFLYAF